MGALAVLGSPFSSGALASFQQQQLYIKNHRLKEYGDCYLLIRTAWELSRGVNGLWIAPIERCFQCELRVPAAEMLMEGDLFRFKMVTGGQVK